jgi:hypothetical protein
MALFRDCLSICLVNAAMASHHLSFGFTIIIGS